VCTCRHCRCTSSSCCDVLGPLCTIHLARSFFCLRVSVTCCVGRPEILGASCVRDQEGMIITASRADAGTLKRHPARGWRAPGSSCPPSCPPRLRGNGGGVYLRLTQVGGRWGRGQRSERGTRGRRQQADAPGRVACCRLVPSGSHHVRKWQVAAPCDAERAMIWWLPT